MMVAVDECDGGYESSSRKRKENENKWVEIINNLKDNDNCN
jgi:hypothetical protein